MMDQIAEALREFRDDILAVHHELCELLETLPDVDQNRLGAVLRCAIRSEMSSAHLVDLLCDLIDAQQLLIGEHCDD